MPKISVVISDLFGASGRRFLDALVAGARSPAALAVWGTGGEGDRRQLAAALTGRFREVHAFEIATKLRLIDMINEEITRLDASIEQQPASIPGVAPAWPLRVIGGGTCPAAPATDAGAGLVEWLDEVTWVGVCNARVRSPSR